MRMVTPDTSVTSWERYYFSLSNFYGGQKAPVSILMGYILGVGLILDSKLWPVNHLMIDNNHWGIDGETFKSERRVFQYYPKSFA
jgi:hypothetical protein